jgi:hypothetical protein
VSETVPPRPHGCLYEILSMIVGLVVGLLLVAAIIAGAAYFFGFI